MTRISAILTALILSASLSSARRPVEGPEALQFQEAEVVKAGELKYPVSSVTYGTVVLEVTIDAAGEVEAVKVVRDIVSLTPEAIHAVKGWKFKPAKVGGMPIRSKSDVAMVFNPALNNPPNTPLPPLAEHPEEKQDLRFSPPQVTQATYPKYPIRSVAEGTVVLQLTLDSSGHIETVKILRDIVSLTPEAIGAVKGWRFMPATLDGRPVRSKIAVAFLFRRPIYPDTR